MKQDNQLWTFFASVKLALFTLCALALTSIIGTIIPQHESLEFYVARFGEGLTGFLRILDIIPNMYGSWWFLGLLGLLSANLIVCSIDRFPTTWKLITADQSALQPERLQRMPFTRDLPCLDADGVARCRQLLDRKGWHMREGGTADLQLLAGQKGRWSRTGVYIVHGSILVIFLGAIAGHFLGFKGSVMLPETASTHQVFAEGTNAPIDLGFDVRCDWFNIEFYPNGMPKEYRSRLTVLKGGRKVLTKDIEVNQPLHYRGITFYQASYQGYRDFLVTITDPSDGSSKTFQAPFQQQLQWSSKALHFGIINAKSFENRVIQAKLWIKATDGKPASLWLDNGVSSIIKEGGKTYTVSVKQQYATGLQVARDPGVWLVYLGCALMLAGLYLAFFMTHRRIWLVIDAKQPQKGALLAGSTNKNKMGFAKVFSELASALEEH